MNILYTLFPVAAYPLVFRHSFCDDCPDPSYYASQGVGFDVTPIMSQFLPLFRPTYS